MKRRGFTLIELLIVVAIIAILAAIAVPNFLEAQVRSKVSRAHNDLRTIATAIESYHVDHNSYPPYGEEPPPAHGQAQVLNPALVTTPIAYLSSDSSLKDPFRTHIEEEFYFSRYYQYCNWDDFRYADVSWVHWIWGEWRLTCAGPDKWFFNGEMAGPDYTPFNVRVYDVTNGTVSVGDIFRTQKEGAEIRTPVEAYP